MDINELYIMLLEEFKMNTWTGLNIQIRYFVEKKLITQEEYELLTIHFKEHRPKKEQWFKNKEERIQFLEKMIELTDPSKINPLINLPHTLETRKNK